MPSYDKAIPPLRIEPPNGKTATSSFIFLHGLGDEGSSEIAATHQADLLSRP